MLSTVAQEQEGPGFQPPPQHLCMFSQCLRGFSLVTLASSHSPKTHSNMSHFNDVVRRVSCQRFKVPIGECNQRSKAGNTVLYFVISCLSCRWINFPYCPGGFSPNIWVVLTPVALSCSRFLPIFTVLLCFETWSVLEYFCSWTLFTNTLGLSFHNFIFESSENDCWFRFLKCSN